MKFLLAAAIFATSAISFAKPNKEAKGVRQFKVDSVQVGNADVQDGGVGTLVLNYAASKVSLNVEIRPNCAKGMMCAQMIRVLKAELPITSIKTDSCGIHTVIASKDDRPVDGSLQLITMTDVADMTCQSLVAVYPAATFENSYFDRLNGKSVTEKTKMVLSLPQGGQVSAVPLLKYDQTSGFSPDPSLLSVTVDSLGQVKSIRRFYGKGGKPEETADLATLSADGMKNLRAQLAAVKQDNPLIDENEGQPECSDAGTVEVTAFLHEVQVPIFRTSGCHTFRSREWSPSTLATLALGLATLAR